MVNGTSGRRATRFAKIWLDIGWWFAVVMSCLLVAMTLLAPVILRRASGVNQMAVEVALAEPPEVRERALASADTNRAFSVVLEEQAGGQKLAFRTRDPVLFVVANLLMFPVLAVALYWIHLLRMILRDVLAAQVFTDANAARLSRMGWLLIGICIAMPGLSRLRSWFVLTRVEVSGAALAPFGPELSSWGFLSGLLLLSLASVWRYGVELQQERELTV